MKYIFKFPDIGEGLEEGTILEWYVTVGQKVVTGDPLVKMETDKVVANIPSPRVGVISALYGEVGSVVKVGSPLAEIEIEGGEEVKAGDSDKKMTSSKSKEKAETVVGTMEVADEHAVLSASIEGFSEKTADSTIGTKALATPAVRAVAKEMGININKVAGTGPMGRVTLSDVAHFQPEMQSKAKLDTFDRLPDDEVTYEPLTQIRKTIARNMRISKHNAAHMSVFDEVEISDLMHIREKYKAQFVDKGVKLTYLPFIIKATVKALQLHRQLNSQLDLENDRMIYNNRFNISIAVDTPAGLVVPVIKDADQLSIFEIAQRLEDISEKARNRELTLEDMKGGTFTITNFGSIGGIFGTPVIYYPQAAILGIGKIVKTAVVKNDQLAVGNVMALSLSVDHRIVDGAEVTRFINEITKFLADPVSLLI